MLVVEMTLAIERDFGVTLSAADVFENPTVEELARRIERCRPRLHLPEDPDIVSPAGVDLDVELEEDLDSEHPLELDPRVLADGLDHPSALADDAALLAFSFDIDHRVDPKQGFALFEVIDYDAGGVRQLSPGPFQELHANDLGNKEPLGLGGSEV